MPSVRFWITAMVYIMVQAVLFGVGTVAILGTSLADQAASLFPVMIFVTMYLSGLIAWMVAPKIMASHKDDSHHHTAHA